MQQKQQCRSVNRRGDLIEFALLRKRNHFSKVEVLIDYSLKECSKLLIQLFVLFQ